MTIGSRGGRRTDHQVGIDQCLLEPLERHGAAVPPSRGRRCAVGVAIGDQDLARIQSFQVLQGQLAHLARPDHEHGLVGEGVEDPLGDIDRHAGDRQLALIHPGALAHQLADSKRGLEHRVEGRADGLVFHGRAIGLANLAQDLSLAQDEALQAGCHPEQMARRPLRRGN